MTELDRAETLNIKTLDLESGFAPEVVGCYHVSQGFSIQNATILATMIANLAEW